MDISCGFIGAPRARAEWLKQWRFSNVVARAEWSTDRQTATRLEGHVSELRFWLAGVEKEVGNKNRSQIFMSLTRQRFCVKEIVVIVWGTQGFTALLVSQSYQRINSACVSSRNQASQQRYDQHEQRYDCKRRRISGLDTVQHARQCAA